MEDLAFERVAERPARIDHRFRTGRLLVIGSRYSAPSPSWQLPPIADSIYAFRPRGISPVVEHAAAARTLVGIRTALQPTSRHAASRSPG